MLDLQPPAPPAPTVLRAESHFVTAAARDIPLVLTKAKRVENAVARYQLYMATQVEARVAEAGLPNCVWTMTVHLQRQLCFTSMTGLFGCSEPSLAYQTDNQKGRIQLTSQAGLDGCSLTDATVIAAERQLSETLGATAQARFEADLKLNVTPMLNKAGATVRRGS